MKTINFQEIAQFQPKQLEAWNLLFDSRCKYLLYGGAAHGGKSYFLRWAALGLCLWYAKNYGIRDVPIGLFSEDYPTLKDRQIMKIKHEFPDWIGELKEFRDEGFAFQLKPQYGNGMILLRNLDDPSKYMSTEFAAELVEELTRNPRETFEDLRFRLRYPEIDQVKFVGATNPGGIGHTWVKQMWIEYNPETPDKEQDRFFFIRATVYDNKFTLPGYIDQLKSLPEQKRKAWLEGSWDIFEGQVFSEFSTYTHVVKPFAMPKEWKRYIAMDWGSNKPFSVGWYAVDYEGRTYLYRELYMNGLEFENKFGAALTAKRLAQIILSTTEKAGEKYEYCVADPSMWNKILLGEKSKDDTGESYAEIMINAGLNMLKGDNDRENGMARYREALATAPDKKPWYQVFESCYNTIRTIPALVYDKNRVEDCDTDGEDHCLVDSTLVDTINGQIAIQDLVGKNGYLFSRDGLVRHFNNVRKTGFKKTYKVEFEDGRFVVASPEHLFLLSDGSWIRLIDMIEGDMVQCNNYGKGHFSNNSGVLGKALLSLWNLLSKKGRKVAQNSLGIFQRINSEGVSHSPQRWQSGKQPNNQLGVNENGRTFKAGIEEAGKNSLCQNAHRENTSEGDSLAQIKRRKKMVFKAIEDNVEELENGSYYMRNLWTRVRDLLSREVFILSSKLQAKSGSYAKVRKITSNISSAVFNLEVETLHCFSVNDGIIVHNCYDRDRYYFMSRPAQSIKTEKPKTKMQRWYTKKVLEIEGEEGGDDPLDEYAERDY